MFPHISFDEKAEELWNKASNFSITHDIGVPTGNDVRGARDRNKV